MCVMCNGPSDLSLIKGAADVELLAVDSEQLIEHLETVLEGVLQLRPGEGSPVSLLDSVPVLTLNLYPGYSSRQVVDADRPLLLNAFAVLAKHSQRLNTFPDLKSAFWMDVLRTKMFPAGTRNVHKCSFGNPEFPRFVVDFSHYQRLCEVNESLGDVLYTFMTTAATAQTRAQQHESKSLVLPLKVSGKDAKVALGFSFARCELDSASLEIIERFLDRAFASLERQYDVTMLDLSSNPMCPTELAIVARIVQKKSVYQFEELMLDEIIPSIVNSEYRPPAETPREFLDIMRAAFDVHKLPQLSKGALPSLLTAGGEATAKPISPSRLRKISMRNNCLCPKYFAALFSALRYGCPLGEDASRYITKNCDDSDDDENKELKKEYWRWLAFGLFYPRPKRFADAFKLRNLGRFECDRDVAETFMSTMTNPVRELVNHGVDDGSYSSVDTLMVCTVKQGASIEIFEFGSKSKAIWSDTLSDRSELEALYEREDGSLCVVVPGVGLGWVRQEFVECIERESLERRWSEQSGWYDVQLGINTYGHSPESMRGLRFMIEVIGRQVRSLSFDYTIENKRGFVPFILANCRNLQRLSLENVDVFPSDGDALVGALSGDLGGRLLSLNLNSCRKLSNVFARKLAPILADTDDPPALQELRLHQVGFTPQGLAALYGALEANRMLELMELTGSRTPRGFVPQDEKFERERLEASYQGQLLQSAASMEMKVAFLSVVGNSKKDRPDKQATALHSLDSWLLSTIFAFAASRQVRRRIAWNSNINQKHYAEEE